MRQRVEALELLVNWKNLMENQTGRKIKMLRSDHVEEHKDFFPYNLARKMVLSPLHR